MPQFSTDIYNVSIQSFRLHTDLEGSSQGLGPMPNTTKCMPPLRLASWHQPAAAIPTARRLLPEGCVFHPQVHISSLLMLCSFTATEAWRTQAPLSAGDALGQPQGPLALNKGSAWSPCNTDIKLTSDLCSRSGHQRPQRGKGGAGEGRVQKILALFVGAVPRSLRRFPSYLEFLVNQIAAQG